MRRLICCAVLALVAVAAGRSQAREDGLADLVAPIADSLDGVKRGDVLVLEGTLAHGLGERAFLLRDASGEVAIYLPEFVTRAAGTPAQGERVRIAGQYDWESADHAMRGVRVRALERRVPETRREPRTPAAGGPAAIAPALPEAGEAATSVSVVVHPPQLSREWVERLRTARRELVDAEEELKAAEMAYSQELRRAGKPSSMNPSVVDREDTAAVRVASARRSLPVLVEQARRAGVDPRILELYQRANANAGR